MILALFVIHPFIGRSADLNQLYATDYKVFWKQWNELKEKALSCKDHAAMSKFLSNALIMLRNAEVSEANAEVIEATCLNKPICLLESLLRMKTEEQDEILKFFIAAPIYHDPQEIRKSLEKHWNLQKYRTIKERYQKCKQTS